MSKVTHGIYISVIGALSIVLIWLVNDSRQDSAQVAADASASKAVAVLPFVDLVGSEFSNEVAEKLTADVIQNLSARADVDVVSAHNTQMAADKLLDLRELGRSLSATVILEGSVHVTEERYRVIALLVDADSGYHIWSTAYDREPGNLDDVVAEIGLAVDKHVHN